MEPLFYLLAWYVHNHESQPYLYWNDRQGVWTRNPLSATMFDRHQWLREREPLARRALPADYVAVDMVFGSEADCLSF